MNIDKYGRVTVTDQEAFKALYSGQMSHFHNLFFDPEAAAMFNKAIDTNKDLIDSINHIKDLDQGIDYFDKSNQCQWFMPENYFSDLPEYLYSLCKTEQEIERVNQELELYIQHGMFDLLFYLKYLVDTMRANSIVWGVGRGSSVSSYVLYLLGVHKINSIKYDLNIHEFLGEKNG